MAQRQTGEGVNQGLPENHVPAPPIEDVTYHVIRLAQKVHPHEQTVVAVADGREHFKMRRGELIPVTSSIIEVLTQAMIPKWRLPSEEEMLQGRRVQLEETPISRYPFERVFRNIPKSVYLALKKRAMDPNAKPITEAEIEAMIISAKGRDREN